MLACRFCSMRLPISMDARVTNHGTISLTNMQTKLFLLAMLIHTFLEIIIRWRPYTCEIGPHIYVCVVYTKYVIWQLLFLNSVVEISNRIRWSSAMSLDGQCVLNELGSGAFYQSQCGWTASSLHHRCGNAVVHSHCQWHRSWSMADRTSAVEHCINREVVLSI